MKDVAGVAGLPEVNNFNWWDTDPPPKTPEKGRRNPLDCRTFPEMESVWTYFVQREDTLIKIGYTASPRRRLTSLRSKFGQSLKALAIVPATVADEFETHQKFAHLRVEGEWFRPAPELWQFIRLTRKLGAWAETKIVIRPRPIRKPKPTPLAQHLTVCRRRHGFDSPVGRHCTGLLEALPTYQAAKDPVQKAYLAQSIARFEAGLSAALKAAA